MRVRRVLAWAALACLTLGASSPALREPRLEIVGASGKVAWSGTVHEGERFDVSFVHSQERTRWTQHYEIEPGRAIRQTGSTFGSYGAGMPLERVRRTNGGFTAALDRRLASIPMRSWKAAGLTLTFRGRRLALDRWFEDYEAFEIRIR